MNEFSKKIIMVSLSLLLLIVLLGWLTLGGSVHDNEKGHEHVENSDGHGDEHEGEHDEELPAGPHGGRLLQDEDFALEIVLLEDGMESEFRAYGYDDGDVISPS
ncbi:MAG: hypothetical protein HUJ30_06120, partial [Gammaproteobacteria bacterium]|nr:hypothetical protein [Gammaproteobacteria bacterium]